MRQVRYLEPDKLVPMFRLCWLAYFTAYLGRLNYAASMAEIIRAEGFSNSACGLVGTGFFICYGAGQLVSGIVGDRVPPRRMVTLGLMVSLGANGLMAAARTTGFMLVVWCVNGLAQSMCWTPILRIFSEYFPPETRKQACVKMASAYPVGTLAVYVLSAMVVYLLSWRAVFVVTVILMAALLGAWIIGGSRLERFRTVEPEPDRNRTLAEAGPAERRGFAPYLIATLAFVCGALALHGVLRDGVMSWLPTYLSETFAIGTSASIVITAVLPVINLTGAHLAAFLAGKLRRNELQTSGILFALAGCSMAVIVVFGRGSIVLSVLGFGLIAACMSGVNLMLVSFVPTYFAAYGNVSTVAGIVNASAYVGSSLSTYGIGAVADRFGWSAMLAVLGASALLGIGVALAGSPGWKRFTSVSPEDNS